LLDPYLELFKDLMKTSRGLRRLGSAAVDLAYIAAGRFEVFYEYGLNPWDVAAGALIVQQAGGKVTDFSNGNIIVALGDNYVIGQKHPLIALISGASCQLIKTEFLIV
jgi:fructose-1,6-bisphosphatase/inositol monophosphatase family enzyme